MSEQDTFCFAHLTDPHLTLLANVRCKQLLNKRLLGYLSWQTKRRHHHLPSILSALINDMRTVNPDHVVITGDLTQIGLPEEFDQVANWLPTVGAAEQVTVIPGNHETYVRSDWQSTFAKWHDYLASDNTLSDHARLEFPTLRIRKQIAFIGVNSAYPSAPFLATGKLGNQQLIRLEQLLEQTRQQGLFRVVLIHHPPIPGITKWRKRLLDANHFQQLIQQFGAELVLYGHTHKTEYRKLNTASSTTPVISVASASFSSDTAARRASYSVFRVSKCPSGHWKLTKQLRQYLPQQQLFAEQPFPAVSQ